MAGTTPGRITRLRNAIIGRSPGSLRQRITTAALRALRTLIQGIAAAVPAAGAGTVVLETSYWKAFGYSCLAAVIVAIVSFLHNVAGLLPEDPTQNGAGIPAEDPAGSVATSAGLSGAPATSQAAMPPALRVPEHRPANSRP